ncbi:MFS transporter [bacterium]|nr:MFS transporter [bacterium]
MVKWLVPIVLIAVEVGVYLKASHDLFVGLLPFVVIGIITFIYAMNNPVGHSKKFRIRSYANWLTLGLTYAFLYMGRYNLTRAKNAFGDELMSKEQFGIIFGVGAVVYGLSFIINGPLTDKLGGKKTMIIGATGTLIANFILGVITYQVMNGNWSISLYIPFVIIYAINMYFQSFGAVSIVKVNAAWFHIKERGVFGGIFGTLISLGIFLAFDLTGAILHFTKSTTGYQVWWAFFAPAIILLIMVILDIFIIKDTPGKAGFEDFNTGDAGSDESESKENKKTGTIELYKKLLTHPVILMMIAIEFCSGILRNGIMHWGPQYAKDIKLTNFFFTEWGLVLMIAGIAGGFFAGFVSDKFFQSRRGPSAFFLYAGMLVSFAVLIFAVPYRADILIGPIAFFASLCVIGVHGMISGTASMDFGGKKAAATTAGIIDGFVYLGTGLQSISLGYIIPKFGWSYWPIFLIPFTVVGLFFTWKIWSAFPNATKKSGGH